MEYVFNHCEDCLVSAILHSHGSDNADNSFIAPIAAFHDDSAAMRRKPVLPADPDFRLVPDVWKYRFYDIVDFFNDIGKACRYFFVGEFRLNTKRAQARYICLMSVESRKSDFP